MEFDEKRRHCACFTGHRPEKMALSEYEVKSRLRPVIAKSIAEGFTTFITGMARGFDLWAADVVLEAKREISAVRLLCALPIEGFEKKWPAEEQEHYRRILREADEITVISSHYSRSCFQMRNKYMADRSARVIAAYNGSAGGTRNTINYAKRNGVEIVNIL